MELNLKNHRESLIENDFLMAVGANDEFVLKFDPNSPVKQENAQGGEFHIYNEYDNLERPNNQSTLTSKRKNQLKDSTNMSYTRGLKRFFQSKVDKFIILFVFKMSI